MRLANRPELLRAKTADAVRCLFPTRQIGRRVRHLARQISADYADRKPLVVGVLKGAFVFMADLVRHLTIPVSCDFIMLSSYGANTSSSGQVALRLDLALPAEGRHLLLVEDIVDTGASLAWLNDHLATKQPASLRVCALLDKPARRLVPVKIDYVGFTVPDLFVVGYGIDCAECYRELPYIGYVTPEPVRQVSNLPRIGQGAGRLGNLPHSSFGGPVQ